MKHALSDSFTYSVKDWLFNFPPHRSSVLLRDLLLDYINCTHECGLPADFKETLEHFQALFRLLAEAEIEVSEWKDEEVAEMEPVKEKEVAQEEPVEIAA